MSKDCVCCSIGEQITVGQVLAIYALGRQGVELQLCDMCEAAAQRGIAAAKIQFPKSRLQLVIEAVRGG